MSCVVLHSVTSVEMLEEVLMICMLTSPTFKHVVMLEVCGFTGVKATGVLCLLLFFAVLSEQHPVTPTESLYEDLCSMTGYLSRQGERT